MAESDSLGLGQGGRAAAWVALYIVCWLLMAWSCNIGLPSDCRRAVEPIEVLIELSVLVAFALGQVNCFAHFGAVVYVAAQTESNRVEVCCTAEGRR